MHGGRRKEGGARGRAAGAGARSKEQGARSKHKQHEHLTERFAQKHVLLFQLRAPELEALGLGEGGKLSVLGLEALLQLHGRTAVLRRRQRRAVAEEQPLPHPQPAHRRFRKDEARIGLVVCIAVLVRIGVDHRPKGHGLLVHPRSPPLPLGVEEKGPELAHIHHFNHLQQENFVDFKRGGELAEHLPDAVGPLGEDGRRLRLVRAAPVRVSQTELVPQCTPLLFHNHLKAAQSAVERVDHHLSQRRDLGRAVPAVGAVDEHRRPLQHHQLCYAPRALQQF